MSSPGNASEFAAELAILRDEGPPISDPDPASLAEREVNRRWAAIRRLGENHVYAADDLIRRQLYATDPSLRAAAIHVLLGVWHRMDLLAHAIDVGTNHEEDPMVRMPAIEALGSSGAVENETVRRLVEQLAVRDDEPGINRAAMRALGRHDS